MTREWVEQKRNEAIAKVNEEKQKIIDLINTCPYFSEEKRTELSAALEECTNDLEYADIRCSRINYQLSRAMLDVVSNYTEKDDADIRKWLDIFSDISTAELQKWLVRTTSVYRYLDSEPMEFNGDIVVTDPCYLMRELTEEEEKYYEDNKPKEDDYHSGDIGSYPDVVVHHGLFKTSEIYEAEQDKFRKDLNAFDEQYGDHWQKCNYGDYMEILGIHKYMTRDTIYGDWSCSVYKPRNTMSADEFLENAKKGFDAFEDKSIEFFSCEYPDGYGYESEVKKQFEVVGSFCADAGLVTVADMSEVLKYNPDFEEWCKKHTWCAFVLKNFRGTVQYIVREHTTVYDWENEHHKIGDTFTEYSVEVVIIGVNTVTGERINLLGAQSAL